MTRIPVTPTPFVRAHRLGRDVEQERKRGPQRWIYVGTYPTDLFTSGDSPPFQNGYAQASVASGYERVRFRFDEHYRLELDGYLDASGGTSAAAAFTLPDRFVIPTVRSWLVDVITGATPVSAQILIPAASGQVKVTLL